MRSPLAVFAVVFLCAAPAAALDMPERKAGLWELKLSVANSDQPRQTMRQCVDAETDRLMKSNFAGGAPQQSCEKQNVSRQGDAFVVESVCSFSGATTRSRAVITGSFDSGYKMDVASRRNGAASEDRMTVDAQWIGPCAAGQRPGDMVMPNGATINIRDVLTMRGGAKRP